MRVVTYGFGMRSEMRRLAAAVAVVAAALCASGCAPDSPGPGPTPQPTSTPLFASDEEALAAAEEAYARYQAVENQIFLEGGRDSQRIESVAVGEALDAALSGISGFEQNQYIAIGEISFKTIGLQSFDPSAVDGAAVVTAYICLDFSSQDVVNSQNVSVVNPERSLLQAFEMVFDSSSSGLKLSARNPWTSDAICAE
jgi:hypothetical protein